MTDTQFKIAEAAKMAGVSASTLRLWEQQGLVEPIRTVSGQRLYDAPLIARLKTIAWLRSEKGLNPAAIRENLSENREAPPSAPVSPDVAMGARVRHLRRSKGTTLEAAAVATGVPVSALSTFERTSQGLSLTSLHAVARFLDTTIAALSGNENPSDGESVVRKDAWQSWPPTSSGVTIQTLADGNRQMECHRFVLARGASSEGAYQHAGEEFLHVLSGSMEIVLDGDRFFNLGSGDSFYFESSKSHAWRNTADGETVLLWINTPATF
ncbi:HTH-type transcriptional regulator PuuR [Variibacter gotjawalensis]|uniref:HTH-type transcriptional regulator PuuR n=1 Tax=Variibacter gotjawalensis TaxID=1333996 RepID=A0A0S3PZ87_9BRAD|nr:MerR family transcriptional regulator [Variibacter gotjawalensis]NIK47091.1 DNA-binding transcriptional MerR regulator/mannose-6-phosphate isomerase-like protein (cupin superfamily) [Variibacter gotjawalensis]RZS48993.1 DNA-binding transcriptional MerR regulator [Variibacter gotjawalensis]BAT61253.1 HTH-type transcriptional regulator PuuR [Variibacter gotjawalensis]